MSDAKPLDDQAILAARGPRNQLDPTRPYAFHVEKERTADGDLEDVATIFVTNRECPYRCLMCDLWKNTTVERLADGLVAQQVEWALGELPDAPHVKVYNAGSFFDTQAIPSGDLDRIGALMADRQTLIVESHPNLINERCIDFAAALLPTRLEVAMGLETVDQRVLRRLNKRMTLGDFSRATALLLDKNINVRAFIMLRTPFQSDVEGVRWAMRSIEFAFSIGVECCVVIPVRANNGIMEQLAGRGLFHPPSLRSLEAVIEYGLHLGSGRVMADLWDIERLFDCPTCGPLRTERLRKMNLSQASCDPVECACEILS